MRAPRTLRAAWAEIDLDALRRNVDRLCRLSADRLVRAVLKADAYGHGAVEVAHALEQHGMHQFAVALVEEGLELRRAGITGGILVMGPCYPGQIPRVREYGLVPTVSSPEQVEMWATATATDAEPQPIHLKVDTGMHRLGLSSSELHEALSIVRDAPGLKLVGLMSHLADADLLDSPRTMEQISRFRVIVSELGECERSTLELHIGNSAGLLHHEPGEATSVRPGLALFGYDPARRAAGLEPVMSVRAGIVQVHELGAGERVGYGGRFETTRASRIGTIPLGYADGYPWRLGGRAEALIDGLRVPVVGAISMDMLALDLTGIDARAGDQVVLLGRDGSDAITAVELADRAATALYGVLCGFGLRLPKLFIEGGAVVAVSSRHDVHATAEDEFD